MRFNFPDGEEKNLERRICRSYVYRHKQQSTTVSYLS